MTREELTAAIVALVPNDMAWPDVDHALMSAAHEIRLKQQGSPPSMASGPSDATEPTDEPAPKKRARSKFEEGDDSVR
jgi:hypothetical protein